MDYMVGRCFNFLRNCHTVLQSGCTFHILVAPHPDQHLIRSAFLILAIPTNTVVSHCISPVANDAEHLFMCSFAV